MYRKFSEHINYLKEINNYFFQKVGFSNLESVFPFKNKDLNETQNNIPIINWENFISEAKYNTKKTNWNLELYNLNHPLFLKKETNRKNIKNLTFPVYAILDEGKHLLQTYNKFKKFEEKCNYFVESPLAKTRYDILFFRKKPIQISEKVNGLDFEVSPYYFKYLNEAIEISNIVFEKFKPDFYITTIIETKSGLKVESISQDKKLTPYQLIKMYEETYQNHYSEKISYSSLSKIYEELVKPHHNQRILDAKLLKYKFKK